MAVHWDAVPQNRTVSRRNSENRESKPYSMQSVFQPPFSTLASNEVFQDLELLYATRLYSLGIMKHITLMVGEHQFVVDQVLAALAPC